MKLQSKESILLFSFIFVFIFSTSSAGAYIYSISGTPDYYCDNQDDFCGCSSNSVCTGTNIPLGSLCDGSSSQGLLVNYAPDYTGGYPAPGGFGTLSGYSCLYLSTSNKCGNYGMWGKDKSGSYDCIPKTGYDEECLTYRWRGYGVEAGCGWIGTCQKKNVGSFKEYNSVHSIDTQCGTATLGIDAVKNGICGIPLTADEGKCISKEELCKDGTPKSQCSISATYGKPYYCDPATLPELVEKCSDAGGVLSKCGCPSDYICQSDGTCKAVKCGDGILQTGEEGVLEPSIEIEYGAPVKGELSLMAVGETALIYIYIPAGSRWDWENAKDWENTKGIGLFASEVEKQHTVFVLTSPLKECASKAVYVKVPFSFVQSKCPEMTRDPKYFKDIVYLYDVKKCADLFAMERGIDYEAAVGLMLDGGGWGWLGYKAVVSSTEKSEITAHELGHRYWLCDQYDGYLYSNQETFISSTQPKLGFGCGDTWPSQCPKTSTDCEGITPTTITEIPPFLKSLGIYDICAEPHHSFMGIRSYNRCGYDSNNFARLQKQISCD